MLLFFELVSFDWAILRSSAFVTLNSGLWAYKSHWCLGGDPLLVEVCCFSIKDFISI